MATDLEKLVVSLEANVKTFERQMARATGEAKKATTALEQSFEKTESKISSLMNSTASSVRTGMAAIGGMAAAYLSTDAIRRYADDWVSAVNRIAAANETRQGAERRASDLTDIALRSNSDLTSTAELYSGLTRSSRDLGASQAQVLRVTEAISKAFAAGGTSAQAAAGSIIQLNQALQSGKLSGDEFNSVAEGAPVIMELLAKKLNVTRGELKDLASDGQITSKVLFEALLEGAATVEQQFATMVPTIEQSLGRLKTALTRYFGQLSTEYDISGRVAAATQGAINNLDTVVKAAAVAGVAIAAAFGGPTVAGIAAASAALALFGDQIQPIAGEIATIGDYGRVAFEYLIAGGTKAGQAFADYLLPHIEKIIGVLTGDLPAMASTVLNAITGIVDGMINAFQYAADAIKIAWGAAGDAIRDQMISAMNGVVDAVNSAVKKSAELINSLLTYLGKAAISVPEIARFENAYSGAGERAAQAMGDSFSKRFSQTTVRDALTGVGASIDAGIQSIRDKANAKADARAEQAREAARARGLSPRNDGSLNQALRNPKAGGDDGGGGADKQSDFEKETEALNKRILALQREKEALSLSAFEAAKAEAAHRLLDAAKKDGTIVTDELRAKIDEQSLAYARAKVALDESKESQKAFNDLQKFVGQSLSGFFSDIVSGGKNASEALMNLTKKLADAALQAVLLGDGPLAGIFGTKGANGATGGLIGALFGGGSTGAPVQLVGAVPAPSFAVGGYTGSGGRNDPAGIVHRGEYVLPAEVVERLGVKNIAALHKSALRGYASGGLVGATPGMPVPRAATYAGGGPSSMTIDVRGATGNREIQAMVAAGVQQAVNVSTKTVGRNAHAMFRNADLRFA